MVDAEINRTVATLQRLLTKRCDLRSEQNRAHDTTHRLPLELKSRIFELVLPTRDEWGNIVRVGGPRGKMPPYLTSVCKSWRDIAWSNPSLWSTIPIVLGAPSTSDPSWVDFVSRLDRALSDLASQSSHHHLPQLGRRLRRRRLRRAID
jgi:hypothetical protein